MQTAALGRADSSYGELLLQLPREIQDRASGYLTRRFWHNRSAWVKRFFVDFVFSDMRPHMRILDVCGGAGSFLLGLRAMHFNKLHLVDNGDIVPIPVLQQALRAIKSPIKASHWDITGETLLPACDVLCCLDTVSTLGTPIPQTLERLLQTRDRRPHWLLFDFYASTKPDQSSKKTMTIHDCATWGRTNGYNIVHSMTKRSGQQVIHAMAMKKR